jgi:serine/threonine protein kinase
MQSPSNKIGFSSLGADYQPPTIEEIQALFPNLEILAFIGHGGMGTYYQARQTKLDRLVAVKILLVDPGSDASLIEGFKREARAMGGLVHPNIIRIYDFGETDSTLFLVMEYVAGDILERLVDSRGFDLQEITAMGTQVCSALAYAHELGVIHRDIRLGNTMLDANGQIKVGDFGLARLVGEELFRRNLTEANQAMGTMDYLAPEQLDPGLSVDCRADVYSVGVMLYKLVTRTLSRGTFVLPSTLVPGLDPRVDEIVIRCMQRNPDNRYQKITDLWAALEGLRTPLSPSPRALIIPKR